MKYLIVVDMQNDFVTGVLGTKEAQAIVPAVANRVMEAISNGWQVIFTKDTHNPDTYASTLEGQKLPVLHCSEGTDGWNLVPKLSDFTAGCQVLKKYTFGSSVLPQLLLDADEVEFCGVCTGICVISNVAVVRAFYPNLPIKVNEKLCACVTPDSHKTAIEAMKTFQIEVI